MTSDIAEYFRKDMRVSKRVQSILLVNSCEERIKESNNALRGETPVNIEKWKA